MPTTNKNKSWYSIVNRDNNTDEADVLIYDEIGGFGVSASQLVRELKDIDAPVINVRLNTPGGDVFEGFAIYNFLKGLDARVIMHIDGIAASIGSIIALAGEELNMAENSFLMIHNPSGVVIGESRDMMKMAKTLDKLRANLVRAYAAKSGKSEEEIIPLLDEETWFSAQEALDFGLADNVTDAIEVTASFDPKKFSRVPDAARSFFNAAPAAPTQENHMATQAKPKNVVTPNEGETHDEFMTRCQAEGGSESECQLKWDETPSAKAFDAGFAKAKTELSARAATIGELRAAFPNHSGFVMDQMEVNASLDKAKAAFSDVLTEESKNLKAQVTDLQAKLDRAMKGSEGVTGLVNAGSAAVAIVNQDDPKAVAESEYDNDTKLRAKFSKKENYVNVRVAQLSGQLRTTQLS